MLPPQVKRFSSDDNVIDRRIVVKMLMTYFEQSDQGHVLNIM